MFISIFFLIGFVGYILSLVFFQFSAQLIIYQLFKYVMLLFFFSLYTASLQQQNLLDNCFSGFQYIVYCSWVDPLQIFWLFGLDSLSIYFILLTTFIFFICGLLAFKDKIQIPLFQILIGLESFLILTFLALDLFLFSCFFESLIILIFILILFYGSRIRRVKALTYFVIYTIFGSGFLFLALFLMYFETQTFIFFVFKIPFNFMNSYLLQQQCLFIVFAIKLPIIPLHLQLTEAHVEAPTLGSIILASLLLKVGGYGFIRFLVVLQEGIFYFRYVVLLLALSSVILSSIEALRQSDLKKIIAYSSIAHINVGVVGLSTLTNFGVLGHLILIISHGFISAGLFLLIGILYERTHSRIVYYHKGLMLIMPLQCVYLIGFILSNVGFPGSSGFLVELLILIGLAQKILTTLLIFLCAGLFLCFIYCVYIITSLIFGAVGTSFGQVVEMSRLDFVSLSMLFGLNLIVGLCPSAFIKPIFLVI